MRGQIIKDWSKVDHVKLFGGDFGEGQDIQHQRAVQKALQFFFALPDQFIPEPATLSVLALGGLLVLRRRRTA